MKDCKSDPLLIRKRAAAYIGKVPGTLRVWDCTKKYDLKPKRIGGRVYYYKSILDKYIEGELNR